MLKFIDQVVYIDEKGELKIKRGFINYNRLVHYWDSTYIILKKY